MPWNLSRRRLLVGTVAVTASAAPVIRQAFPQSYPTKPLHVLVSAPAGSVPDIIARSIGDQLSAAIGQPVVVENRVGAGGITAMQALVRSAPDGHTLALATMSQAVFNSYLFSKLPYDPLRDFTPVALLASNSFVIVVRKDFPAATFNELLTVAKNRPDKLLLGTAPAGTPPHVYAHLLAQASGIEVIYVPYKSGPQGLTGVLRGDIQVLVDSPAIIVPHVKAGTVKVLTVTGRAREPELPDVPTIAEAGFPKAECETWFGLVAPSGTSTDAVARLSREVEAILIRPEIRRRLANLSFEPRTATPVEFGRLIRQEHARWGAVIRDAGIKLD